MKRLFAFFLAALLALPALAPSAFAETGSQVTVMVY